jgi:hypothetical protein
VDDGYECISSATGSFLDVVRTLIKKC